MCASLNRGHGEEARWVFSCVEVLENKAKGVEIVFEGFGGDSVKGR